MTSSKKKKTQLFGHLFLFKRPEQPQEGSLFAEEAHAHNFICAASFRFQTTHTLDTRLTESFTFIDATFPLQALRLLQSGFALYIQVQLSFILHEKLV